MDDLNDHELIVLTLQQCCEIIFSSSSDESEDESNEYEYVTHFVITKNVVPRLQNYVETIVPQFSDRQFKAHFRILPSTFEFVLTLIAIWKMSTPDSYRSICENFDVSRATALKCVRRVIVALEILTPAFITWPNEEKAKVIKNGFFSTSTFPNVLGAIDGTHINIPAPHDHQEAYVN